MLSELVSEILVKISCWLMLGIFYVRVKTWGRCFKIRTFRIFHKGPEQGVSQWINTKTAIFEWN